MKSLVKGLFNTTFLTIFFSSTPIYEVQSAETDPTYAWTLPLDDSQEFFNHHINSRLEAFLKKPRTHRLSCHRLANQLMRAIDLGNVAQNNPSIDRLPKKGEMSFWEHRKRSIYAQTSPYLPLSPTLQINGVRMGVDKVIHFKSGGLLYYNVYKKNLKKYIRRGLAKAWAHERALENVLRLGDLTERSILGRIGTGVFSLADLEANYQGMEFILNLCDRRKSAYIQRVQGKWHQTKKINIANYINPNWDEAWLSNIYTDYAWQGVSKSFAKRCQDLNHPLLQKRFRYYRSMSRINPWSRNMLYVHDKINSGQMENPLEFSVQKICKTKKHKD